MYVYVYIMHAHRYMCAYVYAYIHACGCVDRYGYDCLHMYVSIYTHMPTFIIKLIIIHLISTFVHSFVFNIYRPIFTF